MIAKIGDTGGKLSDNPQSPLRLTEQKHAAVQCQPAAIKRDGDFSTLNRWE